jgi:hypothetical protein
MSSANEAEQESVVITMRSFIITLVLAVPSAHALLGRDLKKKLRSYNKPARSDPELLPPVFAATETRCCANHTKMIICP